MFQKIQERVIGWVTSPRIIRFVFSLLRKHKPILRLGKWVVVSRKVDVAAILTNSADFSVEPIYADAMARTTGPFFLGMDDGPRYQSEANFAKQGARPADMGRIQKDVDSLAAACLASHSGQGQIDVVGQFTRKIPLELVRNYFGVPGASPEILSSQLRVIFWDLFVNLNGDKDVSSRAILAGKELGDYLKEWIHVRSQQIESGSIPEDYLGRLIQHSLASHGSLDADLVRRTVGGVIVGIVDTLSKSMVNVLDALFSRPDALQGAIAASLANKEDVLLGYVLEALRFNPHNPILLRKVAKDVVLANNMKYQTTVAKGSTVVVSTLSAMFDADHLPTPERFIPNRPASVYMHFGYGLHTCFGDRISMVVMPTAIKHLLRLPGIRPASKDSRIHNEGPFPTSWLLNFDPR